MNDKQQPPPYPSGYNAAYPPQPPYPPQQQYPPQQGFPQAYPPQQAGYNQPPQQQPFPPFPPQGGAFAANNMAGGILKNDQNYDHVGSDEPQNMQGFGEKAVRRAFIRKVYSILMCQLVLTGAVIGTFMFVESVKTYVQRNMWVYYTSMGVMLVCLISMACCDSVRRKFPTNFIFLGVFTFCEGVMLGTVSTFYDVDAVLIAVGITAGVTFCLTIFAFQTKIDFTVCGGMLCAVLVIFMIAGFLLIFLPKTKWTMIGFGSVGALIFSLYIVYDTQLMMGGKHKYSLSPEEYVFAALNLYLDIINLFMYILMIVGAARGD
eukprot:TRINITY_DN4088_c0_g1_i1.p1 TRINITY_DN4088_c0_g1~~TRINITY_DN4088_c0_g1_i1.p1  ORF type:complete len:319 (+),score=75.81 TRINITY_DN4088_c0_g1_i1:46-1002(+)